ncbi:hypothetical protein AB9P05_01740 [Roseivirga sp. BDSF3-8]
METIIQGTDKGAQRQHGSTPTGHPKARWGGTGTANPVTFYTGDFFVTE